MTLGLIGARVVKALTANARIGVISLHALEEYDIDEESVDEKEKDLAFMKQWLHRFELLFAILPSTGMSGRRRKLQALLIV